MSETMFASLPAGPRRGRYFAVSLLAQGTALALLCTFALIWPESLRLESARLLTWVAPPPPLNHQPQPAPLRQLLPPPKPAATLRTEPQLRMPPREIEPPKVAVATPPPVPPRVPESGGKLTPPIRTGVFSTGSSAPQTTSLPANKVQTGGFGDPNGVPANNNSTGPANIAKLGSFDLPAGPGYGNGTGGAQGARGVVASAGFGNGVAVGGDGSGGAGRGTIRSAGFADSAAPAPQQAPRARPSASATSAVEVVWKPKPVYTEEARRLGIEGEVILQVIFTATGEVHVLRVVQGLGHGLDEAAIHAASQIRFKPARQDGKTADATALLHIVFQIAS